MIRSGLSIKQRIFQFCHIDVTSLAVIFFTALCLMCNGCSKPLRTLSPGKVSLMQGLPLSGHLNVLATGDLNRDGYMDLVAGSSVPMGHDVVIWYGEGNGTWKKMVKLPVYGSVHSMAIGDINNDGRDDICLSIREGTEGIAIWLNKGEDFWEVVYSLLNQTY